MHIFIMFGVVVLAYIVYTISISRCDITYYFNFKFMILSECDIRFKEIRNFKLVLSLKSNFWN